MTTEKVQKRKSNAVLLIISHDVIGKQMAGPGIRFYEFSRILSNYLEVTLAAPNRIDIDTEGFRTIMYDLKDYRTLKRNIENADIILIQGHVLHYFPFLKNFKGKIIVDLFNPFNLESLEMYQDEVLAERLRIDKSNLDLIRFQLSIGDFFICASEKQRSYWLGMLNAVGRVNPISYDDDKSLRKLIDVVPFGIPSSKPKHTGESIRSLIPQIREDDLVTLWGGGIWNWLDPITVLKAIWEISRSRKDIKLVFTGIKHPDPKLPEMKKCIDAINLSKELGLYNELVFFNEWTPYEMRQNFLLESGAGLSIHQRTIETDFAYRTRVMDYIWANLPVITSEGDSVARMVKVENIGEVVKYENTPQLARVIESILTNKSLRDIYKRNLEKIAPRFYWENVIKPLVKYCTDSHYASDKKGIMELVDLQNSKIANIIKKNFTGTSNILVLTSNIFRDREIIKEEELGKIFYLEVESEKSGSKMDSSIFDNIGFVKSRIISRTRFDGAIINNTYKNINPKFFYDLLNVIGMKLKTDGLIFFSIPEKKGLSALLHGDSLQDNIGARIDEFSIEYLFENTGYEVIERGVWDKIEAAYGAEEMLAGNLDRSPEELYSKNELMDLFEIKLSRKDFKELTLLKGMNILDSEELEKDRSIRGKIKKYLYAVTSLYLENLRKSYNSSIQAINHNIQLQINRELNELNAKNRERMIFIYYNIFKTLEYQISNLGVDIWNLRELISSKLGKSQKDMSRIDDSLEILLNDVSNIDRIMGLTLSDRYFVARKL
jgi:glycosyltransferase involved in cell wall biosynthesis